MTDDRMIGRCRVRGVDVARRTQCFHYESKLDVVAIKFACCNTYYSCYECHAVLADHAARRWPKSDFDVRAVLCGACRHELSIHEYLSCGFQCPACNVAFNPGCASHYSLYFEV